jgi:hypothetical protein
LDTAFENTLDKDPVKGKVYKKPEKRDVMNDIIDAVMLNTKYEAGVMVHRGRELNMHEKPETRDWMLKTNPKGKYNKDVNVNNVMDENNAKKLSRQSIGTTKACDR